MMRTRLFAVFVTLVLALAMASTTSAGDLDCADFASQEIAQTYFNAGGGSANYNYNNLDADHDGWACENHFGYTGAVSPVTTIAPTPASTDPTTPTTDAPLALPNAGAGPDEGSSILPLALIAAAAMCAVTARRARRSLNSPIRA